MKPFLRSQLERYAQRLGELDFLLSREDIMADMAQYRVLSREHAEVTQVAGRYARFVQCEADLAGAREMLADPEMAEMAQEEITAASAELRQLEDELQRLLLPKDPDDARNAFVEIRAGTGGDESALFAAVENQLADGNPLAVKETMLRLRMTGFSHQEALEFIACALAAEIMAMEEQQVPFNEQRYAGFLACLPDMPWDDAP